MFNTKKDFISMYLITIFSIILVLIIPTSLSFSLRDTSILTNEILEQEQPLKDNEILEYTNIDKNNTITRYFKTNNGVKKKDTIKISELPNSNSVRELKDLLKKSDLLFKLLFFELAILLMILIVLMKKTFNTIRDF